MEPLSLGVQKRLGSVPALLDFFSVLVLGSITHFCYPLWRIKRSEAHFGYHQRHPQADRMDL